MNTSPLRCPLALFAGFLTALSASAHDGHHASIDTNERFLPAPFVDSSANTDDIRLWQARASRPDASARDFERLGWAFIAHARQTLDERSYSLALAAADAANERRSNNPDTLLLRGHALHNLHRFAEAEEVARHLVSSRGGARDHALLGDILVERGDLDAAVAATQKFVDQLPGLESFSRIAHLRWLHGDTEGAIAAMHEAVRSGDPRASESQAWALTRLSNLLLNAAQSGEALHASERALYHLPHYPPALLAKGRALLAMGRTDNALPVFRKAAELNPLPEYKWWLADALRLAGETQAADHLAEEIATSGPHDDPRTTALFLATAGQEPAKAVRLAKHEIEERADIHTHDALAWALFRAGRIQESVTHAREALRSNVSDPRILLHAGLIARAGGNATEAESLLAKAEALAAALTPSERAILQSAISTASTVAVSGR